MIKYIVVNLSVGPARDVATDFAVSVAGTFDAHLVGIAFRYDPLIPVMIDRYGIPADVIESQRVENEKAAKAAVDRFDEAAKRVGVSAEARILVVSVAGARDVFSCPARRSADLALGWYWD